MPTIPPRSTELDDVRPPCRTAAVTGVPSSNSGHCSAIPGTVTTLWEPATPCADMPGIALATVLPTPRTFSSAEPSMGVGATLGWGTDLDQRKIPASRTLDAPPRQAWRTVPSTATTTKPTGATRTPARSPQDQGATQDNCHARRHVLHWSTLYFLQWSSTAHPRFGEKTRTSDLLEHVPRPSLYL
jgi:hypothetical protein